jgi:hypothetical protein
MCSRLCAKFSTAYDKASIASSKRGAAAVAGGSSFSGPEPRLALVLCPRRSAMAPLYRCRPTDLANREAIILQFGVKFRWRIGL